MNSYARLKLACICWCLVVGLSPAAFGAILASYSFTGGSDASSGHVGTVAPGPFTVNSGPNEGSANADIGISGSTDMAFLRSDATGSTQTDALADDDFFTFSVNTGPSHTMFLETIQFDFGGSSNVTGPFTPTVYLQSSVGGLGPGGSVLFTDGTSMGNTSGLPQLVSSGPISLAAGGFQNVNNMTFRFSFADNLDIDTSINRLDNVVLTGRALPSPLPDTFAQASFNDLSSGQLHGQAGGDGFDGNWSGSTTINVVAGDLTAPVSTQYGLTQSGTPQSVRGDENEPRAISRQLELPMYDEVWFSFLFNQPDAAARGGIELNPTLGATGAGGLRIIGVGDDLRVIGGGDVNFADVFTFGQTALVLGQLLVDVGGNEQLSLWIDPDLGNLGAPLVVNDRDFAAGGGLQVIGIESYRSGGSLGGTVDMFSISNGPNAFFDVTGFVAVPEPQTWSLLAGGLLGLVWCVAIRRNRFVPVETNSKVRNCSGG